MKEKREQIARIKQMERHLVHVTAAMERLSKAIDNFNAAEEAIEALQEYYGSDVWKQDVADDKAGLLPADLKRGILSEDVREILSTYEDFAYLLDSV